MKDLTITIPVKIDAKLFRDFAMFDTFRIKQRWKLPILFALIMLGFAILCFSRRQTAEQAVFMGSVLLAVGFGLPIAYFINFFKSVSLQIRKLRLAAPQPVYTVTLTEAPDGIQVVTKNGETAQYRWDSIYGVYQGKNCAYLYVQNSRAYLLPDRDTADKSEELRSLLDKHIIKK